MPLSYTVEKQYIFSILIVLGIFMSCNHVQAAKPQLTTCVVKSRLQPMATSKACRNSRFRSQLKSKLILCRLRISKVI
jgi:hypothetical protein